jgi:putative MATE family efflux protein
LRLRSPYDREILKLALPALGALAAEPLYLLADTAMVGHLGTPELAGLALAGTLIAGAFTLFNFLTYGTTAQVARLHGAGEEVAAGRLAAQALWLSAGIGVCLTAVLAGLAVPLVDVMGAQGRTADLAITYLRIGSLGLPFALIALAGQGFLRGVSDLRTPLVIVVVANAVNVLLNLLFIYGFGWGLAGSAWATVVAQAGMGAAFVHSLLAAPADTRRPSLAAMRPLMRIGGEIFVRTASLYASFLVASAVLARVGDDSLGVLPRDVANAADDRAGGDRRRAVRVADARSHRRPAACVYQRSAGDRAHSGDLAAVRPHAAGERRGLRVGRDSDRRR